MNERNVIWSIDYLISGVQKPSFVEYHEQLQCTLVGIIVSGLKIIVFVIDYHQVVFNFKIIIVTK